MSNTSIRNKTVRPGSLSNYSYYYSDRRPPAGSATPVEVKAAPKPKFRTRLKVVAGTLAVAALLLGLPLLRNDTGPVASSGNQNSPSPADGQATPALSAADTVRTNYCAGNTEAKFIRVSVEKRHLWACEGEKLVRDSAVITGLRGHAETETPVGTYKIYAKAAGIRLTGSDSRGGWNYPVHTWMSFLDNQYGTYGFHDATWRPDSEFGSISPDSDKASHGCIELPLGHAQWLYNWAPVGTVLTVEA